MNGLIPLNKPRQMTSAACVYQLRKILHERKIGHTGTLDPDVDGVLPICVGQATKLVNLLQAGGKHYQGEITLGLATTTEDLSGEVIKRQALSKAPCEQEVDASLRQLTGTLQQTPPLYSAVRVNGRHLYEYARAHESVQRPVKTIEVSAFKRTSAIIFDQQQQVARFTFEVICGKGTYVRTLASDCGRLLGIPAVMSDLTRTMSGGINLEQTVTLDQVQTAQEDNKLEAVLWPLEKILAKWPRIDLTLAQWQRVQNGNTLFLNNQQPEVGLYYQDKIKAIYRFKDVPAGNYVAKQMLLANE